MFSFPQAEIPPELESEDEDIQQPTIADFTEGDIYISILPDPAKIDSYFNSEKEVQQYVKKSNTVEEYLNAAMYYHFNALDVIDDLAKDKNSKKKYLDLAIGSMEKILAIEPDNAVYTAYYAGILGVRGGYTSYPALLQYSNSCLKYFTKAVRMDPSNPEVRMQRFLSLIYFPYKYYPSLIKTIEKDLKIVEMWITQVSDAAATNEQLKDYAAWLINTRYQCYYLIGNYYFSEMKKKEKAGEYLSRIPEESTYYNDAKKIIDKL
ncbi:MAG: hypothetical protein JW881_07235 [Spirochaetales bacterium]|nr:hypothetical protein [Spirochaetales bacterium]